VSRLVYATYLSASSGAASVDGTPAVIAVAADHAGNSIVAMTNTRVNVVPHSGTSYAFDALVTKVARDGTRQFTVTLANVVPTAVVVDANANIYVCGATYGNFQTTPGVFQPATGEGFVARLDAAGNLLWASRLSAKAYALALDPSGAVVLTGMAMQDFTTTAGALQPKMSPQQCSPDQFGSSLRSCTDAFVAKVSADGTKLLYATFLGGSREEFGNAVAVDSAGNLYVAGETYSEDFPVTASAWQAKLGGAPQAVSGSTTYIAGGDAFLAKLDPSGSRLLYATYLGGAGVDFASGLAVDAAQNMFVTGTTNSADFPATPGAYQPAYEGAASPPPARRQPAGATPSSRDSTPRGTRAT